jgi:hypothetical protein
LGSKQYINPHSRFSETIFRNASGYLWSQAIAISHLSRPRFSSLGLIDLFDFDPKNNRAGVS